MAVLFAFGDSITQGLWDEEGGWVQRLRKYLDKKYLSGNENYYCPVFNLGVSGDTSRDILERIESEIKARLDDTEKERTIIILSFGSNDSIWDNNKNKNWIPPEDFRKNINEILNISKRYSRDIFFVGETPADEKKVDPIPWVKGCSYKNKFIETYNKIIEEECEKRSVCFIDIYNIFQSNDYEGIFEDGIHLNSQGHQKVFEIVRDSILERGVFNK